MGVDMVGGGGESLEGMFTILDTMMAVLLSSLVDNALN